MGCRVRDREGRRLDGVLPNMFVSAKAALPLTTTANGVTNPGNSVMAARKTNPMIARPTPDLVADGVRQV
jgi:hypothetical protein